MLYVFNRNEEIVAILENGNKDSCPYYDAKVKSVLNGEQILNFKTTLEHEDAKALEEHGYIARKNKFNQWQLFLITEMIETHGDFLEIEVTAEASFVELDGLFIELMTFDRKKPAVVLPAILAGTRWETATIEGDEIHDLTIKNKSILWALQKFRERWGIELSFEIEITANYISKRKISCYKTKGLWSGKRFEYSKDLVEVVRNIEAKNVKTALYGVGREIEESNGLRMDFANVEWVAGVNGAPMNKPLGQKWLGDEIARETWGKKTKVGSNEKQHVFGLYETTENTDSEDLLWETWVELTQVTSPNITYDLKVIDLYKILGLEPEAINLGDQGAVIDRGLGLQLQARVIEYEEDLINQENDQLVLGNFVPRFTDLTNKLEELDKEAYRAGDAIPPSWLDTQFSFASDAIKFGGGTVIMTENDGILIVDNVDNPQRAIKLNAGQIALANSRNITTNTFNWRNFGTGSGWLADFVEVGKLRFERSEGGTLSLGGPNNGNGQLIVYDDNGLIVGDLDATKGGFTNLYVGNFSADNVLNSNNKTLQFIVYPDTGNDNNNGLTNATAFQTIQKALDSIPKHNNGRVEIYIKADVVFNEYEVHIQGFFGSGSIALYFNGAQHNGMIYIIQNVQRIELYSGFVNQIKGTAYLRDGTISVIRTLDVYMKDMQVYSRANVDFGVKVRASHCTIDSCNFYDSTTAGVNAEYGGYVEMINDNYGSGAWSGIRAVGTGRIAVLNNTVPLGTINIETLWGGEVVGTITSHQAGTPKTLVAPPLNSIFQVEGARSWNSKTKTWNMNNNFIYQGELQTKKTGVWGEFITEYNGNWKGCFWFNNAAIISALTGRTVISARIKLKRLTYGGFSGSYLADLWTTPTDINQAGTTTEPVADYKIGGGTIYSWGEDDYISVPPWIIDGIFSGDYKGFMLYSSSGANYMIFDNFAQLEITYQ